MDLALTRSSAKQMQLAFIAPGSGPHRLAQNFMGKLDMKAYHQFGGKKGRINWISVWWV